MKFQHMFVLYPGSIYVFDRLGDTYRKTEQYDLSLEYYQKFLEIEPANPRALGTIEQIKIWITKVTLSSSLTPPTKRR